MRPAELRALLKVLRDMEVHKFQLTSKSTQWIVEFQGQPADDDEPDVIGFQVDQEDDDEQGDE